MNWQKCLMVLMIKVTSKYEQEIVDRILFFLFSLILNLTNFPWKQPIFVFLLLHTISRIFRETVNFFLSFLFYCTQIHEFSMKTINVVFLFLLQHTISRIFREIINFFHSFFLLNTTVLTIKCNLKLVFVNKQLAAAIIIFFFSCSSDLMLFLLFSDTYCFLLSDFARKCLWKDHPWWKKT